MRLFLSSRRVPTTLIAFLLTGIAASGAQHLSFRPLHPGDLIYPLALVVPALLAILISAQSGSPASSRERASVRSMRLHRALALAIVLPVGASATALATWSTGAPFGVVAGERNLAGFAGLALLGAVAIGPRLAWLIPLLWIALPPFFFSNRADDPVGIFTFYAQPVSATTSAMFATAVLVFGVGFTLIWLPRNLIAR